MKPVNPCDAQDEREAAGVALQPERLAILPMDGRMLLWALGFPDWVKVEAVRASPNDFGTVEFLLKGEQFREVGPGEPAPRVRAIFHTEHGFQRFEY